MRDPLPEARDRAALRVVGVGNPWRGDDAAGLVVAARLRDRLPDGVELLERQGEPTGLLAAWEGAERVWLVDAVSSGAPAGTVHRVDAGSGELPAGVFRASTHAFGLAEAVGLARALGRLPTHVVVFGIEGAAFAAGEGLTPAVEAASAQVAETIREEVARCTRRR